MITKEQAVALRYREVIHQGTCNRTVGPKGGVQESVVKWRVNGAAKVWTTRPDEFLVPLKHGLRHYSYLTETNDYMFHREQDCPLLTKETSCE